MRHLTVQICVFLLTHFAWASDRAPHIWILPFDNLHADASLEYLTEAVPALLAVAISQSQEHAVVDRQHLNQVLSEQSLTLAGLTSPSTRHRVGRLLGATVMISGSFSKDGQDLLITLRASDVETGIVTAAAEASGPAGQLGPLLSKLFRKLAQDLGRRLPDLRADQIDEAPLSNLHFMRGLVYYYSARYNHAIVEFMEAAEEEKLSALSRLWLANAYLAQQQYGHAYLELSRLIRTASRNLPRNEVEAKISVCEKYLGAEEIKMIRELAVLQGPTKE